MFRLSLVVSFCICFYKHGINSQSINASVGSISVERGSAADFILNSFEIAPTDLLLDLAGGYLQNSDVIPLVIWNDSAQSFEVFSTINTPIDFTGRVTVPSPRVMRVENYGFADSELQFAFRLNYKRGITQTRTSTPFQVDVTVKAAAISPLLATQMIVTEGDNVTLYCKFEGKPQAVISWTDISQDGNVSAQKNSQPVNPGPFISESNLTITNIKINESGQYSCSATNDGGTAKQDTTINVQHKPIISSFTSNVQDPLESVTAQLDCVTTANPPTTAYHFYFNGIHQQTQPNSTWLLPITNCTQNTGNYSCIAENAIGNSSSSTFLLNAQGLPFIYQPPQNQTINESFVASFSCYASGCPSPVVSWQRSTNPSFPVTANQFSLTNIQRSDTSTFTCVATNQHGTKTQDAQLVVNYRPVNTKLSSSSMDGVVGEGSRFVLNCTAVALPVVTSYRFYKEPNTIPIAVTSSGLYAVNISTCGINNGTYSCEAINALGVGNRSSYHIDVHKLPVVSLVGSTYSVIEGSNATLHCNASGCPMPFIEWNNQSLALKSLGNTLHFNAIGRHEAGFYTCNATNKAGSNQKKVYVEVQYPPTVNTQIVNPLIRACVNEKISLRCAADGVPVPTVSINSSDAVLASSTEGYVDYNITMTDPKFGVYFCFATNSLDTDYRTINVDKREVASVPISISVKAGESNSLVVSWERPLCIPNTGVSNFQIYAVHPTTGQERNFTAVCSLDPCEHTINDLEGDVNYLVSVAALDDSGHLGDRSDPVTGMPPPAPITSDNNDDVIIGVSVAAAIILLIIIVVLFFCCCRKKESHKVNPRQDRYQVFHTGPKDYLTIAWHRPGWLAPSEQVTYRLRCKLGRGIPGATEVREEGIRYQATLTGLDKYTSYYIKVLVISRTGAEAVVNQIYEMPTRNIPPPVKHDETKTPLGHYNQTEGTKKRSWTAVEMQEQNGNGNLYPPDSTRKKPKAKKTTSQDSNFLADSDGAYDPAGGISRSTIANGESAYAEVQKPAPTRNANDYADLDNLNNAVFKAKPVPQKTEYADLADMGPLRDHQDGSADNQGFEL